MTQAKRILLLDTGNEWGGGTNSMFELLKRLDRERFAVTCCFYKNYRKGKDGRLLSDELADIGIPLLILPIHQQPLWAKLAKEVFRGLLAWSKPLKRRAVFGIEMVWRIRPRARLLEQTLRDGKFDLLYMNNQPASNLEGYLAGESFGVPVIQHARIDTQLSTFEVATANRVAHQIICNSNGLADSLSRQGINLSRLTVVHNGIDLATVLPDVHAIERAPDELILGTVGSLVARKCVDHLVMALDVLRREHGIKAQLIVVGEGPDSARLAEIAKRKGLESKVVFTGFSATPLAWIQCFDIFLFASRQEGFGRVLIEAMLCKTPVISADVVGPREVVEHGITGFLYPHGNIPVLVNFIVSLARDRNLATKFGSAGYRRVQARFSIDAYVQGVSQVLSEALA